MSNNTSKLQQWLENIWYNNGKGFVFLLPLSLIYCALNCFQRWNVTRNLKPLTHSCSVIVVGNITVGGTGKTPLTVHIVKTLQNAGYKPAIITRGYGGKSTKWPQEVTATTDPTLVGDEAVLMASRTAVPVYAGANRLDSIQELMKKHDCDVIISDDGLQHYKLPRDIQIAVVDSTRYFGNGYCLPAGPLREKEERLKDCDLVVLNGEGFMQNDWHQMQLKGTMLVNLKTNGKKLLIELINPVGQQTINAVTGIGNPDRFYKTLSQAGLSIKKHSFPDHHAFEAKDLKFDNDNVIMMTEKDAVKCQTFATDNCWYLPVSALMDNDFDDRLLLLLDETKKV